jgi:Tfp pilus assembly protein PilN
MPIDAVTPPFASGVTSSPVQLPKGMKAVNLLPTDLRGAPKASAAITARQDVSRGPGAFIVLGALAFGVLALAGYVLTTNTIKDRQAQISQLEVQQQAAEKRVAALKPYAEFDQLAKGRVATLRDLAGKRFDWDQTLRDLSRALPQDVTIKSLTGSLGGATANPGAGSGQQATTKPSITLTGCTRNQKSVARLMARLSTVNGVTRVKLTSSTKSAAATAPTSAPSGSDSAGDGPPCGEGARPDFNLSIEFAGAASDTAAPAASTPAAPATAAASGTATPAATPAATATTTPTPAAGGTQASTTATTTTQGGAK